MIPSVNLPALLEAIQVLAEIAVALIGPPLVIIMVVDLIWRNVRGTTKTPRVAHLTGHKAPNTTDPTA